MSWYGLLIDKYKQWQIEKWEVPVGMTRPQLYMHLHLNTQPSTLATMYDVVIIIIIIIILFNFELCFHDRILSN
jgi:hypothetical protein